MADLAGSCFVIRKGEVDKTLRSVQAIGKKLLEPLKSLASLHNLPLNILEDKEVVNDAEVHKHEGDLWLCLEGEVTFIYGGELVEPRAKKNPDGTEDVRELKAKEIRGGIEVILKPGDWLWIPAGEPHQHKCAGVARLAIIKIPKRS